MENIIPQKLYNSKLEEISSEDMNNQVFCSKLIGLLFTASWCSPCSILEKELLEIYPEANIGEKILEIIHIPFDRKESEYKSSIANKPWLFVSFHDNSIKLLSEKYKIISIPVLIIFDAKGNIICDSARKDIMEEGIKAIDRWVVNADEFNNKNK